ncbi:MAG: class I SAM-dependent methyltransferase [Candidatus Saganbacteria bacterium]|nr:class I SAM-dependent methyltransferase [Candidatus Saganbacteria bacterium]
MKEFDLMRPKGAYEEVLLQREKDGFAFFSKYKDSFIDIDCPACGERGEKAFEKYGFTHKICDKCKTLFCSPRPNDELLGVYYNEYEAPKMWTKLLVKADASRKALQYAPRAEKIVDLMKKRGKNGGLAVDIGAGSGAFSIALKNTGFFSDVITLDFSKDCVAECKRSGLNARLGTVTDLSDSSANLICMNDLLEHLFDPLTFLKKCANALRPKGVVSIATPNGQGFDFQILKEKTGNITPPEHLNYFNPASLSMLLNRAGFETISAETPGILDVDIILNGKKVGFPLKQKNEYLDSLMVQDESIRKKFQKFLSENGLSSHMLVMAKKK